MSSGFTFGFGGHGDYIHSSGSARNIFNNTAAGSIEGGVDNRVGIGRDVRGPGGLRDFSGANDESLIGADIGANMHLAGESSESHLQDVLLEIAGDDQIETSFEPESLSELPQVSQIVSSLTTPIDTRASPSEAAKEKGVKEVFHNLLFQRERPHGVAPVDSYNKPYDFVNFMPGGGTSAADEASVFRASPNWFFRTNIGVMTFTGNCKNEYATHLREHAALMGTHSAVVYVDSKGQDLCLGWVPVGLTVGMPPTYAAKFIASKEHSGTAVHWKFNADDFLSTASPIEILLFTHGLLKFHKQDSVVDDEKTYAVTALELNAEALFKTSDYWKDADQMPTYCIFPCWHAVATTSQGKFSQDKEKLLLGTFSNFAEYYDNQTAMFRSLKTEGLGSGNMDVHKEVMTLATMEDRAAKCKENLRAFHSEVTSWASALVRPFFEQDELASSVSGTDNEPKKSLKEGLFVENLLLHFNPDMKLLVPGTEIDPECRLAHVSPYLSYSLTTRMVDRDSSLSGVTHQIVNPKQPQLDELWERWMYTQQDEPWQTTQLAIDWKRVRNASINHRPATKFLSTPYTYPKLVHNILPALQDPMAKDENIAAHQKVYNFWPSFGIHTSRDLEFQKSYYDTHKPYFRQTEGIFYHDFPLMPRTVGALQMDMRTHIQVSRSPQQHFTAWLTGDLASVLSMTYAPRFNMAAAPSDMTQYTRHGMHAIFRRAGMKKKIFLLSAAHDNLRKSEVELLRAVQLGLKRLPVAPKLATTVDSNKIDMNTFRYEVVAMRLHQNYVQLGPKGVKMFNSPMTVTRQFVTSRVIPIGGSKDSSTMELSGVPWNFFAFILVHKSSWTTESCKFANQPQAAGDIVTFFGNVQTNNSTIFKLSDPVETVHTIRGIEASNPMPYVRKQADLVDWTHGMLGNEESDDWHKRMQAHAYTSNTWGIMMRRSTDLKMKLGCNTVGYSGEEDQALNHGLHHFYVMHRGFMSTRAEQHTISLLAQSAIVKIEYNKYIKPTQADLDNTHAVFFWPSIQMTTTRHGPYKPSITLVGLDIDNLQVHTIGPNPTIYNSL